jgi:CubicO group peptidase (beta-lactamase class C family)
MSEIFIGAPPEVEPRIATLVRLYEVPPEAQRTTLLGPDSLIHRAMAMPEGNAGALDQVLNTPFGHAAEIPAVSGIMSARDLARFYACLANYGVLDGVRILSEQTVRRMAEVQTRRPDKVIITIPIGWSLGYMNGGAPGWPQGPRATSFGHPGFGGSVGFADPEIGMSFGFVVNGLMMDLVGTGRTAALADAARSVVERRQARTA